MSSIFFEFLKNVCYNYIVINLILKKYDGTKKSKRFR